MKEQEKIELKPCPFCGGEAKIDIIKVNKEDIDMGFTEIGGESVEYGDFVGGVQCQTLDCGASIGGVFHTNNIEKIEKELTYIWNRRVENER